VFIVVCEYWRNGNYLGGGINVYCGAGRKYSKEDR
jgi:hypothetical protein